MYDILRDAYPDHTWQGWMFPKAPDGFWRQQKNVAEYLHWLSGLLYPVEHDSQSWHRLRPSDLVQHRGGGLLELHNGSITGVFKAAFPNEVIRTWKYERVALEYWNDYPTEQRAFFDYAQKKLGLQSLSGWYDVTRDRLAQVDRAFPLDRLYGGSLATALQAVYPSHSWQLWRFKKVPRGFWDSQENQKAFFDALRVELGRPGIEDMYSISRQEIISFGGSFLLQIFQGNIKSAMESAYPGHKFEPHRFQRESNAWTTPPTGSNR
jgi:hypothetical protein